MKKYLLFILLLSLVFSCNENDTKKDIVNKAVTVTKKEKAKISGKAINYPSIPQEIIVDLYENCNYMDYIFNDLDFSLSQSDEKSIKGSLGFISTEPPVIIPDGCKTMGRKFFQANGDIVLEAEVYFTPTCSFYLFFIDGKPTYANKMTPKARNFYNNIIQQGNKQAQDIKKQSNG